MTDVLKIALERRTKLQEEVEKLDDFIRMAESLIRGGVAPANVAAAAAATAVPTPAPTAAPAAAKAPATEAEESPMRAAARRLSETEPRRAEPEASEGTDVPRPSIIRRGLAG